MNKIENAIWTTIIGFILGIVIMFGINIASSEPKFEVYYYDFKFVVNASKEVEEFYKLGMINHSKLLKVAQKVCAAARRVAKNKNVAVTPSLVDICKMNPMWDCTSDVYQELCRG